MTLKEGIDALLTQYRRRHIECLEEASDRHHTQEYRTWHHIMAKALAPVVEDLDRLLTGDAPAKIEHEMTDKELVELLTTKKR